MKYLLTFFSIYFLLMFNLYSASTHSIVTKGIVKFTSRDAAVIVYKDKIYVCHAYPIGKIQCNEAYN